MPPRAATGSGKSLPLFRRRLSLSGFYETAEEIKGIALVFVLLGVFVFAVAFAVALTTRILREIHLGLLYALEESRQRLGA
jgi:hypothetical protein